MPAIPLMRTALHPLYRDASDAHPGLLLQRGYREHESGNAENVTRTEHVRRVCGIPAGEFYTRAYERWVRATADEARFAGTVLKLETRLFIGLSGSGMLETGCAIHHSYGVPYIPGSSVKGVVNAFVRGAGLDRTLCDEIFGAAADPKADHPDGLSGLIAFHDAWWVPDSAQTPLVEEVVTTHHPDYYGQEGAVDATDLDSPVPNAQVAVRGSFLFTLEGPTEWLKLAVEMLEKALAARGIGAKTRAGYGYFEVDQKWRGQRDRDRQRAEDAARETAEQAAREERRKTMSPVERSVDEFLAARPDKAVSEASALIGALKQNRWTGDERQQVAAMIKSRMVASKSWRPTSQAKRPDKDKDYQNTLLVMKWLET
jgi:CRISPR-associated protein Cmr6